MRVEICWVLLALASCASEVPITVVDIESGARIQLARHVLPFESLLGRYESPQCGTLELSSSEAPTVVGRCRSQRDGREIFLSLRGTADGNFVRFTFEERLREPRHVARGYGELYYDPPRFPGDRARLFGRRYYWRTVTWHKGPTLRVSDDGWAFTATARDAYVVTSFVASTCPKECSL